MGGDLSRILASAASDAQKGQLLRLTGAQRVGSVIGLLLFGAAALAIGWYGRRHGAGLLPGSIDREQVEHRQDVLRRGAAACLVAGVVVVLAALAVAVG